MTELLCRLFVKDRKNIQDPTVRRSYGTLVSTVGIILNILLAVGKYTVGLLFGAISIQADGINNLSDAGSQIISLVSFKIAAKPADDKHPYGHARIEYVASMIVSFLILTIGVELLKESIGKILHPVGTQHNSGVMFWITVVVLSVSILVKLWLCLFNRKVANKINSGVMRATSADSLSDAIATAAVLAATLVHRFTDLETDGYMGVIVACLILWAGIKILNETKNAILGERPSEETVEKIRAVVSEYDGAVGIHDLVVHDYGPGRVMASLHVEVDGAVDVYKSHDMIDLIERRLREEHGIAATVHMDPVALHDPAVVRLRALTESIVTEIDERLTIHDFRMVPGQTHTNLIFDVVAPFTLAMSEDELRDAINTAIRARDAHLFTVITVDRA